MNTNKSSFTTPVMILVLFLGAMVAKGNAPDPPALGTPDQTTLQELDDVKLEWTDSSGKAMWFQVYVQKDGAFYTSQWIRGDDAVGMSSFEFALGKAVPGNYSFWVKGWEPCYGAGMWSVEGTFTVNCRALVAPGAAGPGGNYDGFWPSSYFSSGDNPTATWTEISVYRDGVFYGSQWVQKSVQGAAEVATARQITGFDPLFPDGDYTWECRDYSPCGQTSDWSSSPSAFTILNTFCEEPPAPLPPFFIDLYHFASDTANQTNQPNIPINHGAGGAWSQIYISSVATGQVVLNEWIYFDTTRSEVPFLSPGSYKVYTRRYNRCGIGSWTENPEMFTISSKTAGAIQNMEFLGYDCDGRAHAVWECQPGNDWYQVYVSSGGGVVMDQWVDASSPAAMLSGIGPVRADGFGNLFLKTTVPCVGPTVIYVRAYANSGQFGEWEELTDEGFSPYHPAAPTISPVSTLSGVTTIDWSDSTPYGQYEIYLQREGQLYFSGVIDCEYTGAVNPSGPEYPAPGATPSEVSSYFRFCDGDYKVWVRSLLWGARYGDWSEPVEFSILPPL